jgi:hypothetical protein
VLRCVAQWRGAHQNHLGTLILLRIVVDDEHVDAVRIVVDDEHVDAEVVVVLALKLDLTR